MRILDTRILKQLKSQILHACGQGNHKLRLGVVGCVKEGLLRELRNLGCEAGVKGEYLRVFVFGGMIL